MADDPAYSIGWVQTVGDRAGIFTFDCSIHGTVDDEEVGLLLNEFGGTLRPVCMICLAEFFGPVKVAALEK